MRRRSHLLLLRLAGAVGLRVRRVVGRVLRPQGPLHLPFLGCAALCCAIYSIALGADQFSHCCVAHCRLAAWPQWRMAPATPHGDASLGGPSSHAAVTCALARLPPLPLVRRCTQAVRLGLLPWPVWGALGCLPAGHGRLQVCGPERCCCAVVCGTGWWEWSRGCLVLRLQVVCAAAAGWAQRSMHGWLAPHASLTQPWHVPVRPLQGQAAAAGKGRGVGARAGCSKRRRGRARAKEGTLSRPHCAQLRSCTPGHLLHGALGKCTMILERAQPLHLSHPSLSCITPAFPPIPSRSSFFPPSARL